MKRACLTGESFMGALPPGREHGQDGQGIRRDTIPGIRHARIALHQRAAWEENYRRFACVGNLVPKAGGFRFANHPQAARSRRRGHRAAARQENRPLEVSAPRRLAVHVRDLIKTRRGAKYKLEIRLWRRQEGEESASWWVEDARSDPAPFAATKYTSTAANTCAAAVPTAQATQCTFKSGKNL